VADAVHAHADVPRHEVMHRLRQLDMLPKLDGRRDDEDGPLFGFAVEPQATFGFGGLGCFASYAGEEEFFFFLFLSEIVVKVSEGR
jgi:hypothetical protein